MCYQRRSALCSYERGEGAAAYAVASAADVSPPVEMESSAMESTWSRRRTAHQRLRCVGNDMILVARVDGDARRE